MSSNEMSAKRYDVVIIGSGPGGFSASVQLTRFGKRVCIIEKDVLGGTCLNIGCIPTKVLVAGRQYYDWNVKGSIFGLSADDTKFNFDILKQRQNRIVSERRENERQLFNKLQIDYYPGEARFIDTHRIAIQSKDMKETVVSGDAVLVATGSRPLEFPGLRFSNSVLHSAGILELKHVPSSLTIVGGGVIGCEIAQTFSTFGSQVSIVEAMDSIIPQMDENQQAVLTDVLQKKGIEIITGIRVDEIKDIDTEVEIRLGDNRLLKSEKVLICIGRKTNIENLDLEKAGIKLIGDRIEVGKDMRTSNPAVYAVGDIVEGPQIASKGVYEGFLAAENILGFPRHNSLLSLPQGVFTEPQLASIGMTEKEAKVKYEISTTISPYSKNAYAEAYDLMEGFVKIICHRKDGGILGIHIVGHSAIDLIGQASFALNSRLTIQKWLDVALTLPHPSYSEVLRDAIRGAYCGFKERQYTEGGAKKR